MIKWCSEWPSLSKYIKSCLPDHLDWTTREIKNYIGAMSVAGLINSSTWAIAPTLRIWNGTENVCEFHITCCLVLYEEESQLYTIPCDLHDMGGSNGRYCADVLIWDVKLYPWCLDFMKFHLFSSAPGKGVMRTSWSQKAWNLCTLLLLQRPELTTKSITQCLRFEEEEPQTTCRSPLHGYLG